MSKYKTNDVEIGVQIETGGSRSERAGHGRGRKGHGSDSPEFNDKRVIILLVTR